MSFNNFDVDAIVDDGSCVVCLDGVDNFDVDANLLMMALVITLC